MYDRVFIVDEFEVEMVIKFGFCDVMMNLEEVEGYLFVLSMIGYGIDVELLLL